MLSGGMTTHMDPQQRDPWAPPGSPGWIGPPAPGQSGAGPHGPYGPYGAGAPGPQDRGPSRRSGAGWGGTVAAAVLAAALAAGGTAAAFTVLDDDTPAASSSLGSDTSTGTTEEDSGSGAQVPLTADGVAWAEVAEAAAPSVVAIGVRSQTGAGQGSGVIIDADDGLVLTNNHVVAGAGAAGQVQVALNDGRVFGADVVGTDPSTDLAVLRLQDAPGDLQAISFGDSDDVRVGEPVMAVGNPLGLSHTITTGIVSAVDRPVTTQAQGSTPFEQGVPVVTNAIQTDAAVNPGNSGGALVDASGRLIGINSSIATTGSTAGTTAGSIGLGFAIPVNQARWVADQLLAGGSVEHAYLGVTLEEVVLEVDGARREAAGIQDVVDGTPAAQVGLQPGEAVLAVDGETVVGAESLVAQVREREPGTEVTLTVADADGQVREVTVEFGARPAG